MTRKLIPSQRGLRMLVQASAAATILGAGLILAFAPDSAGAKQKVHAVIQGDTLVVTGGKSSDTIALRLSAGYTTTLQVDIGDNGNAEFEFPLSDFTSLEVYGGDGDDTIRFDETNGAIMGALIDGGDDDDTITGGNGSDTINGGSGNDSIAAKGGLDVVHGGDGNDTIVGGDGDDQSFGDAGNDTLVWNPGDDTDLNEGGDDTDTVEMNGGNGAEVFTATANGPRVRFDRLSPALFALDIGTSEELVVNMNGGNDSFSATGDLATLIKVTVNGGAGNDTILGTNGADRLLGGDGNDFVDGQQGVDTAFLGSGDDVFQWDPGDGSDTVEGEDGVDTMLFNGNNGPENFVASANGQRVLFTRNLGTIVMDLNDVETIDLNTLGAIDNVTVNPLAGTDLTSILVDLAAAGGVGDAQPDTVVVTGTAGVDAITVAGDAGGVAVTGLSAAVSITGHEPADTLTIDTLDGADSVNTAGLQAGVIQLIVL